MTEPEEVSAAILLGKGMRACKKAADELREVDEALDLMAPEQDASRRRFHLQSLCQWVAGIAMSAIGEGATGEAKVVPGGPMDGFLPDRFTFGDENTGWGPDADWYLSSDKLFSEGEPGRTELETLLRRVFGIRERLMKLAYEPHDIRDDEVKRMRDEIETARRDLAELARDPMFQ
jgi:hypothetical protein